MAKEIEDLTLYVRGMNKASDMEDVWDDRALNSAYDKALKMANEEVAKRIAMETNSNQSGSSSEGNAKQKNKQPQKAESPMVWKAGMPCRAIYEEDGLEYEAFIVKIINDEEGIVKFLGYDDNEKVTLSTLKRSLGDQARMNQLEAVAQESRERGGDDGFESQLGSESVDLYSDESSMQEPTAHIDIETPRNKKKKKSNKKSQRGACNFGELPTLTMPNLNMFRNMDGAEMAFPPPPPMVSLAGRSDAEEQAISDMLLSWYMTGYYTGLYQGMKRQRQSRRYQ